MRACLFGLGLLVLWPGAVNAGLLANESFEDAGTSATNALYWDGQSGGRVVASERTGNASRENWNSPPLGSNSVYVKGAWAGCNTGRVAQVIAGVGPGTTYVLRGIFYWDNGFEQPAHVQNLILEFLDATQACVGQVSTNLMQSGIESNTWTLRSVCAPAPAGTKYIRAAFGAGGVNTSGALGAANLELLDFVTNVPPAPAVRYFRIWGPTNATILACDWTGFLRWTNAATGGTN